MGKSSYWNPEVKGEWRHHLVIKMNASYNYKLLLFHYIGIQLVSVLSGVIRPFSDWMLINNKSVFMLCQDLVMNRPKEMV